MTTSDKVTREEFQSTNANVMDKLDQLSKQINQLSLDVAELPEKMSEKFDCRYASKRTEQVVDRLTWLVLSAVIVAGLALIIR